MMIATSEDDDDEDGDGATGDEVNDDSDGAMGDGVTGYNDKDDNGKHVDVDARPWRLWHRKVWCV
jgi:hypothetical protein